MEYNFGKEVKLFMIFDILGDMIRTGTLLWCVDRDRLEDIKDHITDMNIMYIIIRRYLPSYINSDLVYDYILCHDLPEVITGDITKFQGVSDEEIKRVTDIAIDYLSQEFSDLIDFKTIISSYESKNNIEAKIVNMLDKLHAAITFMKYQSEKNIDVNNPNIIPELRYNPFVDQKIKEGKDLADIFYEFHYRALSITDEECEKYNISREDANLIVNVIRGFANEIYGKKLKGTLLIDKNEFPSEAMIYNKNSKEKVR